MFGKLPMDEASRAARADAMGMGDVRYRGHSSKYPPKSTDNMFMSDDYGVAETYADSHYVGDADGVVTPLRHNANNLLEIDAEGQWYEDLYLEPHHAPDLNFGTYLGTLDGTEGIGHAVLEEGKRQGVRFKDIGDDMYAPPWYSDEELIDMGMTRAEADHYNTSTVENIFGSRPDVKIRHAVLAAYDPQYNGPNIRGSALAGAVGLGALGQSEDADASLARLAARGIKVTQKINNPKLNDMEFSLLSPEGVDMGGARVMDPDFSGVLRADQMELYPEHRGQGLMDMLYDAIEEMTGSPMGPSHYLTLMALNSGPEETHCSYRKGWITVILIGIGMRLAGP